MIIISIVGIMLVGRLGVCRLEAVFPGPSVREVVFSRKLKERN